MKKVLVSIKPQWGELIFNGKKTIEVRRNRPKLEPPFEVLVYETKGKTKYWSQPLPIPYTEGSGKVIGSFICDRIDEIEPDLEYYSDGYDIDDDRLAETCLTREQLREYGNGVTLYGWHIAEPKLFDKPKELREFKHKVKSYYAWQKQGEKEGYFYQYLPITRPPQSWRYVEEY